MASSSLHLVVALLLPFLVSALQVTPSSPCASMCIDLDTLDTSDPNSSNTKSSDIVCEDVDFTTSMAGTKWQQCMSCLQNSTFSLGSQNDQGWFLYNLRYSFDYCVFGYPNGTERGSNPCETTRACGPLKNALIDGNLTVHDEDMSEFGYCDADGGSVSGSFYHPCLACVSATGSTNFIANALVALEAGCLQRPNSSQTLGLNATVFSSRVISIVDPSAQTNPSHHVQLSMGAKVGIVLGTVLFTILTASCIFLCYRRHKKRALRAIPNWHHKRQSSFSLRCRRILASPMTPKFLRDTNNEQTPYLSIDQMTQPQISGVTSGPGSSYATDRYYIETNPKDIPYQANLAAWNPQEAPSSLQTSFVPDQKPQVPDGPINFSWRDKKAERVPISIVTGELPLAAPPTTYHSPVTLHSNPSSAVDSATTQSTSPTSTTQFMPPAVHRYNSDDKAIMTGAGGLQSPAATATSPRMKGHAWPNEYVPPLPPPPPKEPHHKHGFHGGMKKRGKKESGSPKETKQIQVVFPPPPKSSKR